MDKEKKQLIVFGYGLAVILAIISFHVWRHHGWHIVHVLIFPCIVGLILVTAINYKALKPLYAQWMKVAHLIGSVITGILLSILFYLVFGIAGIVLRLLGKDLLDRKVDHNARSYWINRERVEFNRTDYTRQF